MTISWSFLRIKPNQVYRSQDHPAWETLKITQQEYEHVHTACRPECI